LEKQHRCTSITYIYFYFVLLLKVALNTIIPVLLTGERITIAYQEVNIVPISVSQDISNFYTIFFLMKTKV
jgi:hypothetical protein